VTRAERDALRRLQAAADSATPLVRARILKALTRLQESVSVDEIERALRSRDVMAFYSIASTLPAYLRPALVALQNVIQAGVRTGIAQASALAIKFDLVNEHAVRAARDRAALLVTQITRETRSAIQSIVARSFADGIAPRDAARLIRPLIGLTVRQANAVLRRYEVLITNGLSRRAAERQARAYAQRLLRYRALTIARTETISAASSGQLSAWQQLQRRGRLAPAAMKVWIVTPDDRLCRRCRAMDGKTVPLDAQFVGAFGSASAPPLHPNCRCGIGLTFGGVRLAA
jgi:SPP1 gp7 family putative phage head morphogenesis protein